MSKLSICPKTVLNKIRVVSCVILITSVTASVGIETAPFFTMAEAKKPPDYRWLSTTLVVVKIGKELAALLRELLR